MSKEWTAYVTIVETTVWAIKVKPGESKEDGGQQGWWADAHHAWQHRSEGRPAERRKIRKVKQTSELTDIREYE